MVSEHAPEVEQSMRASCDRCRTQKLKCAISEHTSLAGAQRCERCIRAKAHCVFTRRARGRRNNSTARPHVQSHSGSSKSTPVHGFLRRMGPKDFNASTFPSPGHALASPMTTDSSVEDAADEYFSYIDTIDAMAQSGTGRNEDQEKWNGGDERDATRIPNLAHDGAGNEVTNVRKREAWALDNDYLRCLDGQATRSLHLSTDSGNSANMSPMNYTDAFLGASTHTTDSVFSISSATDGITPIVHPDYDVSNLGLPSVRYEPASLSPSTQRMFGGKGKGLSHALRETSARAINGEIGPDRALPHRDKQCWLISQLASLIQAIYETLRVLGDGSWTVNNSPESLEDYPIGRILHLSRHFSEVLQEMSSNGSFQDNVPDWRNHLDPALREVPCPTPAHTSEKRRRNTNSLVTSIRPDIDATTVLLLLSGYVSLVKLHLVVFTHIEAHISTTMKREPRSFDRMRPAGAQDESLHFGELPFVERVSAQAFTAVRMLLDNFRMVEEGIGLPAELCVTRQGNSSTPGVTRRQMPTTRGCSDLPVDLIPAVLMHDALLNGRSGQEGFTGLLSKIDSLKFLLRQNLSWD